MKEYNKSSLNRIKRGQKRASYDVKQINAIIDAGFIAQVPYSYQGRAISIPMSYGRKGNKIYLHGSNANRMLLNLLEQKEMSMTIVYLDALVLARSGLHHSVNYRSATLFGTVQKIESSEEKEKALMCVVEHIMKGRWAEIRPMHQKEIDRTLVVEMTINEASAKIRDTGVHDEPEDQELDIWAGLVPLKQIAEYPIPDTGKPQNMEIPEHVLSYYQKHKA